MIPSDPTSLLTLDLVFVSMSKQSNTLSEASEVMRGYNRGGQVIKSDSDEKARSNTD